MNSLVVTSISIRLIAGIVALVIVASWPRVRGKLCAIGALSVWTFSCGESLAIHVLRHYFGRRESFRGFLGRYEGIVLGAMLGALAIAAAWRLRSHLVGEEESRDSFFGELLQNSSLLGGMLVILGMTMPWAYGHRRWVSGWASSLSIDRIHLPGFLVAVAAVIAVWISLSQRDRTKVQWLSLSLCGYGLLHTLMMALGLLNTPALKVGFGVMLCVVGFVMISFRCLQSEVRDDQVGPETQSMQLSG